MRRLETLVALPALTAALDARAAEEQPEEQPDGPKQTEQPEQAAPSDPSEPRPVLAGVVFAGTLSSALAPPFGYSYLDYLGKKKPRAGFDIGVSVTQFRRRLTERRAAKGRQVRKYFGIEVHLPPLA